MILSAATGDDERPLFALTVKELRTRTTLPGKLFEIDRGWSGKD